MTHWHKLIKILKAELRLAIAVLILLGYTVGFGFASPAAPTPDLAISQLAPTATTAPSDQLHINNTAYNGLVFGAATPNYYPVTSIIGEPIYRTEQGLTAIDPKQNYRFTIYLERPLTNNVWYLDFKTDTELTLNDQPITDPTMGINLEGATSLRFNFQGGTQLKSFGHSAPTTGTDIAADIQALHLTPTTASVAVGATRSFLLIALDANGNTINVNNRANWTVSDSSLATIHPQTGQLTTKATGTLEVRAQVGNKSAAAQITIQPRTDFLTRTTAPTSTNPTTPPVSDTTDTAIPESTATTNLFTDETAAQRYMQTGYTRPTQAEINQMLSTLPTISDKLRFRLQTAWQDITTTLQEIANGRTLTDPETNQEVKIPSALTAITNFFQGLFD